MENFLQYAILVSKKSSEKYNDFQNPEYTIDNSAILYSTIPLEQKRANYSIRKMGNISIYDKDYLDLARYIAFNENAANLIDAYNNNKELFQRLLEQQPEYIFPIELQYIDQYKTFLERKFALSDPQWYAENSILYISIPDDPLLVLKTFETKTAYIIKDPLSKANVTIKKDNKVALEAFFKKYALRSEDIKPLPYKFVKNTYNKKLNQNCLISTIIEQYHINPPQKKKIAIKSIEKYFQETTIESLVNFLERYNINYTLFDPLGNKLIKADKIMKNGKPPTNQRSKFQAVIYNNHIYNAPLESSQRGHNFELTDDEEQNVFIKKLDTSANFIKEYTNLIAPNHSFLAEKDISAVPLLYYNKEEIDKNYNTPTINNKEELENRKSINSPENQIICIDMNKAYYNIMNNISEPDEKIPIFTIFDNYQEYDQHDIQPNYYYLISLNKKTESYGINNNFQSGFIVIFLLKKAIITKQEINYYKKPQTNYNITILKLREVFQEIEEILREQDKTLEKNFAYYDGIMGMKYRGKPIKVVRQYNDQDQELLQITNKKVYNGNCTPEQQELNIAKDPDYLYLNTRNCYNYCVHRTNLYMLKYIYKIKKHFTILRIKTDSITFILPKNKNFNPRVNFKIEKVVTPIPYRNIEQRTIQGEQIIQQIEEELKIAAENIKYYEGPAGSGKTTKAKQQEYHYATAITNLCCRNLDTEKVKAETFYTMFSEHNKSLLNKKLLKYQNKTILVDEIFMLSPYQFNLIYYSIKKYNTKYLLLGDPRQIGPPSGKNKIDKNNKSFQLLTRNKEEFKEVHRYKDDKKMLVLTDYILNNLTDDSTENDPRYEHYYHALKNILHKKELQFKDTKIEDYDIHLVSSNNYKEFINQKIIKERNLLFNPQSYKLSKGLILVADANKKTKDLKIYKFTTYKLLNDILSKQQYMKLQNLINNEIIQIPATILNYFKLGFARTIHSVQGQTIDQKYCIHNSYNLLSWQSGIFYTAITRATKFDNILFIQHDKNYNRNINYAPNYQTLEFNKKSDFAELGL